MVESTNGHCQSGGYLWSRLLGLLYRTAAKYRLSCTIMLYHTSPVLTHGSTMLGGCDIDAREESIEQHTRALVDAFADELIVVAGAHTEDEATPIDLD